MMERKESIYIFNQILDCSLRMFMFNKNKNNSGLTLIEIMIGVLITSIMMAAMYTSYNVVNQSYSKVSDKAKISKSSRDLTSMIMSDLRMSGFKYYAGSFASENFSERILNSVKNLPENWHRKTITHRKKLAKKYSEINEMKLIKKLVKKISSYY